MVSYFGSVSALPKSSRKVVPENNLFSNYSSFSTIFSTLFFEAYLVLHGLVKLLNLGNAFGENKENNRKGIGEHNILEVANLFRETRCEKINEKFIEVVKSNVQHFVYRAGFSTMSETEEPQVNVLLSPYHITKIVGDLYARLIGATSKMTMVGLQQPVLFNKPLDKRATKLPTRYSKPLQKL